MPISNTYFLYYIVVQIRDLQGSALISTPALNIQLRFARPSTSSALKSQEEMPVCGASALGEIPALERRIIARFGALRRCHLRLIVTRSNGCIKGSPNAAGRAR